MRQTLHMCSWLGPSVPLPWKELCLMMDITGRVNSHSFVLRLQQREWFPYRSHRREYRGKMGFWEPRRWDFLLSSSAAKEQIWGPEGLSLGRGLAPDLTLRSCRCTGLGFNPSRIGLFQIAQLRASCSSAPVSTSVDGAGMRSDVLQVEHAVGRFRPQQRQGFLVCLVVKPPVFSLADMGKAHGRALRIHREWGEGSLARTARSLSLPICKESA